LLSKIKPDIFVPTLQDIPLQELSNKGIKGLIIDLDNTLTNWNCSEIDPIVHNWINNLTELGFKICIVSNNSTSRIEAFVKKIHISFVPNALKPSKRAFLKAMQILETDPESTAVIGDQLFTDILGGKRVGATTILVPPLSKREFFGTKIMRRFERIVLKRFY